MEGGHALLRVCNHCNIVICQCTPKHRSVQEKNIHDYSSCKTTPDQPTYSPCTEHCSNSRLQMNHSRNYLLGDSSCCRLGSCQVTWESEAGKCFQKFGRIGVDFHVHLLFCKTWVCNAEERYKGVLGGGWTNMKLLLKVKNGGPSFA